MASFNRALKRKSAVQKKKALKKGLKNALKEAERIPKSCTSCGAPFTEDAELDKWYISLSSDNITLECPNCSK
tara:strand:+ start:623 stop:841 length:219 start_codon:yes stop_codon:yes gene_type:complete